MFVLWLCRLISAKKQHNAWNSRHVTVKWFFCCRFHQVLNQNFWFEIYAPHQFLKLKTVFTFELNTIEWIEIQSEIMIYVQNHSRETIKISASCFWSLLLWSHFMEIIHQNYLQIMKENFTVIIWEERNEIFIGFSYRNHCGCLIYLFRRTT